MSDYAVYDLSRKSFVGVRRSKYGRMKNGREKRR
jgi:hypothetical protein